MQILPKDQRELLTVDHNGKEYIAFYVEDKQLTLEEIRKYTLEFRERLQKISPKQDTSKVPVVIFTQLFVA
jgi:hypothetical protein